MKRLKIYVHSFEAPPVGLKDKDGAKQVWTHNAIPWSHASAKAQKTAKGLALYAGLFEKRCLSEEESEFLLKMDDFCRDNAVEYDVVDVGRMTLFAKLALRTKGVKTPAISSEDRVLCGIPSEEEIKKLLKD